MVGRIAAYALGVLFFVAAVTKFAAGSESSAGSGWVDQARSLGVRSATLARAVPVVELVIAALLLAQIQRRATAWAAVVVLVAFTVQLARLLRRDQTPVCACFGSLSTRPIGPLHLGRNAMFIVVAVIAAVG